MKLWDIVKNIGSAVIANAVPGGGLLLGAINGFLPDDKKLPDNATGSDVQSAINQLPPEQQALIMEKEFDVDMTKIRESNQTVRAMLESDAKNPQSTRPYIAKGSFHVIAFSILVIISAWAYGVITGDDIIIKAVVDGWPFVLAAIGPLVVLLHAYFGVLKQEHKNKLDAANGSSTPAGLAGILSNLIKRR